ncbi:YozQ family protein [Halalkalibacter urbisdiaboli]|uniref:YozQ family protein n=1 Tax=Halalkalibacter urbisdiaboli TaxID=1960589 RepID=UPI000B4383D5|nr:YozQ family protein [Halalkalibacter urbisdiaboli]
MKKKLTQHDANTVAENNFQVTDYNSSEETEQGLAMTHEQVKDMYVEGTVDGEIDEYRGKDIDLPKGGFKEDVFKEK